MSWSGTQCTSFLIIVNYRMYVLEGGLKLFSAMNRMMGNSGAAILSSRMRIACVSWIVMMKCI